MRLTKRRVRKLREIVESQRCQLRPGIVHDFEFWQEGATDPFYSHFVAIYRCTKCGAELEIPA